MSTSKKKLIIAIIAETYPPEINGAARFGQRLADGLSQRGHKVYVVAPSPSKGNSYVTRNKGVTEYRLKSHSIITHTTIRLCFPWQIKKLMEQFFIEKRPDIVHIQCHFSLGRLAVKLAQKYNIPVVATFHVMPDNIVPFLPLPKGAIKRLIDYLWRDAEQVLSQVNVITAPTELAIQSINKHLKRQEIIAISNGVDPDFYELKEGDFIEKRSKFIILFVGRLSHEKNIDVLIKAIAKIPESLNVFLEIVGEGQILGKLRHLVEQLNKSQQIKFLGSVDDERLRQAYIRASIFCMPGIAELQSLATLEAMSASLPVIAANALALPHLVKENKNGYLFKPGDSDDLVNKITRMAQLSPQAREQMGKESRKLISEHHLDTTISLYETIYAEQVKDA
ncbi:glycosyltransferase [Legionella lytica]|uniref:Glycosyltransferase n=1 Tax=Legionella lytica TaxID=96232 RepID=A0ABW8D7A6_9GAMM